MRHEYAKEHATAVHTLSTMAPMKRTRAQVAASPEPESRKLQKIDVDSDGNIGGADGAITDSAKDLGSDCDTGGGVDGDKQSGTSSSSAEGVFDDIVGYDSLRSTLEKSDDDIAGSTHTCTSSTAIVACCN